MWVYSNVHQKQIFLLQTVTEKIKANKLITIEIEVGANKHRS